MRTTITIDDHLLQQARELAASSRRTLGQVVDDALRILFADTKRPEGAVDLPVFGGSGVLPGVDLEDKDALAVALGDERTPDAAR